MKITILTLLCLFLCNVSTAKGDVVTIATDAGFAPFTFVNEAGELDGFEVKLLQRACKTEGLKCNFVYENLEFGDLLPGLKNNQWDVAFGAVAITDERLPVFDFVTNYKSIKFFYGQDSIEISTIPDDLSDMTIGAEKDTVLVTYLEALSENLISTGKAGINIVELDSTDAVRDSLLDGSIALAPMSIGVIDVWEEDPAFENFGQTGPEILAGFKGSVFGGGDGFAFRKGDPLQFRFGRAMQSLLLYCKYSQIEEMFFEFYNAYSPLHCRK